MNPEPLFLNIKTHLLFEVKSFALQFAYLKIHSSSGGLYCNFIRHNEKQVYVEKYF